MIYSVNNLAWVTKEHVLALVCHWGQGFLIFLLNLWTEEWRMYYNWDFKELRELSYSNEICYELNFWYTATLSHIFADVSPPLSWKPVVDVMNRTSWLFIGYSDFPWIGDQLCFCILNIIPQYYFLLGFLALPGALGTVACMG